jgi:2,3-bisphosphoglycerate-independent phosphoglycerate mutase
LAYFERLEKHVQQTTGTIASITGRYYAMDRDNRWERIKVAYDAMVNGIGKNLSSITAAFTESYATGITDEFIEPFVFDTANAPGKIENGDTVISFNFRTDRPREITIALTQRAFPEYNMQPLVLDYYTMTNYDASFKKIHVLFEKDNLKNTLGEVLSKMGRKMCPSFRRRLGICCV